MHTGFLNPTNDCIDIIAWPVDLLATYGHVLYAVVIDAGGGGLANVTPAGGVARSLTIINDGEELPCFLNSIDAGTTVTRIRIFFNAV